MVATPNLNVSEGRVFSVSGGVSPKEQISHVRVFAVYAFPTAAIRATEGRVFAVTKGNGKLDVSNVRVMAVVRGRTATPKLRIWTATLDGHDFVFLRLGDTVTLVYDTYSTQWVEWTSNGIAWRANTGTQWPGAQGLANTFGSDIVVGDDTFGVLWFLDPNQGFDQHPDIASPTQQLSFDRIVTGQVLAGGRQYLPCYAICLDTDNYGYTATDFVPSVVLEYSDDQGRSFINAGSLPFEPERDVNNPYQWLSLGQISSPGRIFRVTDTGVLIRIDAMEMNEPDGR